MAEFQMVVKEYRRLCDATEYCLQCPLAALVKNAICCEWGVLHCQEEAERIIMQWAKENPLMTNGRKFREVFGHDLDALFSASNGVTKWLNEEYKGRHDEQ